MPGKLEAVELGYDLADCADSAVCFLVGGGLARADRPNGLVCDNYALSGFLFNALIERTNLGSEEGIGNACFALLKGLADANDRENAVFERSLDAHIDGFVGLAEVLPALAVADDSVFDADVLEHIGADLTGESALCRPVDILGAEMDIGFLKLLCGAAEIHERGTDDYIAVRIVHEGNELGDKLLSFVTVHIHFPVACDKLTPYGLIHEACNAGKGLAFEEFKARAAAGGDMIHPVAETEFIDSGCRIAAADDGNALAVGACARDSLRAVCEIIEFKYAEGSVPYDRTCFADD